jgi:hypothetical protein
MENFHNSSEYFLSCKRMIEYRGICRILFYRSQG